MRKALALSLCITHSRGMNTHADIIRRAGFPRVLDLTGSSIHTVRSWVARDSIPAKWWKPLSEAGITSLDELADAASREAA